MNAKLRNKVLLILVMSLVILGCEAGQILSGTPTPYPTLTPYPTYTPAVLTLPEKALVGRWEEYWGVGDNSDVTYHDVYDITLDGSKFQMVVYDRPQYTFEDIEFDGNTLSLRLDNDGFLIDYVLSFGNDPTVLVGTAETSAGLTFRIVWAKLK